MADNAGSGLEFERIGLGASEIDVNHAEDLVVVGVSNGNPGQTHHGLVAPQSDLWFVTNARFYNFNNGAAALGDCCHCDTPLKDSGARTTRFSNLMFDSSVEKRIRWRTPRKGIFHDLDGTLTEQGADSYVSPYWPHNDWPECNVDMPIYDGIICPSPYSIQRMVFSGADGDIGGKTLFVWQYDENQVSSLNSTELEVYLDYPTASHVGW